MTHPLFFAYVVMPVQTIGFYNRLHDGEPIHVKVVIPIQTIGFYNLNSFGFGYSKKLSYLSKR